MSYKRVKMTLFAYWVLNSVSEEKTDHCKGEIMCKKSALAIAQITLLYTDTLHICSELYMNIYFMKTFSGNLISPILKTIQDQHSRLQNESYIIYDKHQ